MNPGFIAKPLAVRVGRHEWKLLTPLKYRSYITGRAVTYTVPAGFVSDGESVPEIPVIYHVLAGDDTMDAGFLHDYLYRTAFVARDRADSIYLEALEILAAHEKADRLKRARDSFVSGSVLDGLAGVVTACADRFADRWKDFAKWIGVRVGGWMFYNRRGE